MKKEFKIIKKLTKKVGASLALLKNGTKRSVVLIAADKIGLIAVLGSKISSDPLNLGLNFHSFKAGIVGTSKEIIPAPAFSFLVRVC